MPQSGQNQVLLHRTETLELVGILPFPEGLPIALSFTPDARYLIVGGGVPGKSGVTVTFDITTGERLLTVARKFDAVLACDIRPGFDLVATGGPSRLLKVWNTESGDLVHSVKKHTDWITAFAFGQDGSSITVGRDMKAKLWKPDFSPARDLAQNLPALPIAAALDFQAKHAFIADAEGRIRPIKPATPSSSARFKAIRPAFRTGCAKYLSKSLSTSKAPVP